MADTPPGPSLLEDPFPPAGRGPRWEKNDDGKPPFPPSWKVSIGSFGAPLVPALIGSQGSGRQKAPDNLLRAKFGYKSA